MNNSNTTAYERILDALRERGCKVTDNGTKADAQCPVHNDRNPSLRVTRIKGQALVYCHARCDTADVMAALGLTMADLYDERRGATYRYDDGRIVHKTPDKRFSQSGNKSGPPQLYHLSRLEGATDGAVYLVEGEKDVHAIESEGGIATTAPMGAANFAKVDDVTPLAGRYVIAVVDRDAGGDRWAAAVRTALHGVAAKVRFVHAEVGCKDAADHVGAGHGLDRWVPYEWPEEPPDTAQDQPPDTGRFAASLIRRSELRAIPPVEPLIDGVLSRRVAAILVGPTGAGKTFLALAFACAVGTGRDWLGRPVKQCPVLYTVGEGAAGLDARISAYEAAWNDGQPVADDQVIFAVRPGTLADRETWVEMQATAKALGVGLIILDTLSSLGPDLDETKDAATVTRRMADLAAAIDGTVVLVHHPGWSDDGRTRGGYQWEANTDEVLVLHGSAKSAEMRLERKKVKDGENGPPILLRRKAAHGSCVVEGITAAQADTPIRDQVLAIIDAWDDEGPTGPQLAASLGIPKDGDRSALYRALRALKTDGTIRSDKVRGHAHYRRAGAR